MKTLKIVLALLIVSQFSVNAQEKKKSKKNQTYAELSIKEGGKWNGRKYEGGTFKNVTSLKVPKSHWDHSFFIRYEGPGWESSKIGYRLYLDWRNCIDLFGKVTDTMVLSKVGLDGFESYHHMSPWGMDILKAGKGLGVGAIGRYSGKEVLHFQEVDSTFAKVENDKKCSTVTVNYDGWKTANDKINFESKLSIKPNERITKHTIKASNEIDGICTGIVSFKNAPLVKKESSNKKWAYIATYGEQSLVPDNLGMAIFYEVASVEKQTEGEYDHLLLFKPTTKPVTFYFLGAWEQEKDGIKSESEFYKYLDNKLNELNSKNKI
ncbi:DUF4861 family protein [Flavobacterium capsici]|uniref:DUF4861 family protein n=1 Tax=Flavobacterium capsici TaxID=3075618 RepID=A0AA96EY78_9FLAO|nr:MULTISPECIES: DUF4861 family protein [unclassified Flavobacterium]WNM17756.1 DUF4861 family protein [Flavobacterium sp. PMR2A8]WNM21809.1 DUF4861 family protein [Flavobacterium sp. PMTSA4]